MILCYSQIHVLMFLVSILILLDYLFLLHQKELYAAIEERLNPYFIGLPILITPVSINLYVLKKSLNPYFIGLPILINEDLVVTSGYSMVSILILLDYLFLLFFCPLSIDTSYDGLNPYFIGLPILIV